ncbi:MAG: hypothetical protein V2J62_06435 [candidate division KSB1 bacterium]|nr:hypothetical protein [candidate division KSB1 bacterium]
MNKILYTFVPLFFLYITGCCSDTSPVSPNTADSTSHVIVRKPNVYIYPTHRTQLELKLIFPKGGAVIESEPLYNDGWVFTVDSSGLIDGEHHYLYYECDVPDAFQRLSGWRISGSGLDDFFRENMRRNGFRENEIADFIEFWTPLLDHQAEYIIYPQFNEDISPVIKLDFSIRPDHILRLFYLIIQSAGDMAKPMEPVIPNYSRTGFHVAEWGVILTPD